MTDDRSEPEIVGPGGFDIRAWLAQLPRYGWTTEMIHQLPEQLRFEIIDGELLLPNYVWDPEAPIPRDLQGR
jgi:hypothetical protein